MTTATLKDVARLACVDVSTVSRALNNTSYVHPETKARIMAAVQQLSYRPNVLARGLREGKRRTIGVIVPTLHMSVFSGIIEGLDREARKSGYAILLCHSYNDPAIEKECLNRLRNGFIDALVIAATGRNSRLVQDINVSGIPVIQIVREQVPSLSSIVADYEATGYNAVRYLYDLGSRNIGFLGSTSHLAPFRERYSAYRRAMQELELPERTLPSSFVGHDFDHGYQGTQDLLFQFPDLDAIIASTDTQGMGAMRRLHEQGKRIPEDVRVISLTGQSIGGLLETGMTAMELPAEEMGHNAAHMAIDAIEAPAGTTTTPKRLIFPASLVEREST